MTQRQKGSLLATFLRYASLQVVSMVGLSCYILADTFFVSLRFGSDGLAALNLALPVFSLINGLGLCIGVGGSSLYAVHKAAREESQARRAFAHSLVLALGLGLVLLLGGTLLSGAIARMLGAEGMLHGLTQSYLSTLCAFAPAFLLNNLLVAFSRADQNPRLAMSAMLLGSFSNIVLDWVMIFPLNLGMRGAALATGIAPVLGILWVLRAARRRRPGYALDFGKKTRNAELQGRFLQPRRFGQVLSLGASALVTEGSSGLIMLLMNGVLLGLAGSQAVAAYGIVANLALMAVAVFTGLAQGVQPLLSAAYGGGRTGDIRRLLRYALCGGAVLGLLFCAVGWGFPRELVALFNQQGDSGMGELAAFGLSRYFLAFLLMGVNIVGISALASLHRPRPAFLLSLQRGALAVVPLLFLFSSLFGLPGVWWVIPAVELSTLLPLGLVLRRLLAKGGLALSSSALGRADDPYGKAAATRSSSRAFETQ